MMFPVANQDLAIGSHLRKEQAVIFDDFPTQRTKAGIDGRYVATRGYGVPTAVNHGTTGAMRGEVCTGGSGQQRST